MKNLKWFIAVGLALLAASAAVYGAHYLIFHDAVSYTHLTLPTN